MTTAKPNGGAKVLGLGALACVACCAGPILAVLGGLSIAGLASTTIVGGTGFLIAAAAAVGYLVVRRRRSRGSCGVGDAEPMTVGAPTRKPSPLS